MSKVISAIQAVVNFVRNTEPAAIGGFVVALFALVAGVRSGQVTTGLIVAFVAAVQALLVRNVVTPVAKVAAYKPDVQ